MGDETPETEEEAKKAAKKMKKRRSHPRGAKRSPDMKKQQAAGPNQP